MIRVEALNHKGRFRALGVFQANDIEGVKKCQLENDKFFLRTRKVIGKKRFTINKNFNLLPKV